MVSQPPPTEVGLVCRVWKPAPKWRSWRRRSHSSRTLWPGGSRSEWRPGWWPNASPITPSGPGHCWYASTKNGHVKVRNIAQALINAHCGRLSPAEVERPSVIEMHMPDGVRLIGARLDGQQPTSEGSQ